MEGREEEVASKLHGLPAGALYDEEDTRPSFATPEGLASPASGSALSERGHAADASTLAEHLSNLDYVAEFGRDWKSAHVNHRFTREGALDRTQSRRLQHWRSVCSHAPCEHEHMHRMSMPCIPQ